MPKTKVQDISPLSPAELGELMADIWAVYPDRDIPHLYVPARRAVAEQLAKGADPDALLRAARRYRDYVAKEQTEPKYVKSLHNFYKDEMWRAFNVRTVQGRTREEWAKSGQDVLEWDRLAGEESA